MLYVHTRLRVFFYVLKVFLKKMNFFFTLNYFFVFLDRFDMLMSKIKFKK